MLLVCDSDDLVEIIVMVNRVLQECILEGLEFLEDFGICSVLLGVWEQKD
jgi:hypothetical protein